MFHTPRVERAGAPVLVAQHPSKSEIIRAESHQRLNIVSLQRSRESRKQPEPPALLNEGRKLSFVEVGAQTPAALLGRIDHGAHQPVIGKGAQGRNRTAFTVGEQHRDHARPLLYFLFNRSEHGGPAIALKKPDLDESDAGGCRFRHGAPHPLGNRRKIACCGAHRPARLDPRDDLTHGRKRHGAEGASRRRLQIDDIRAFLKRGPGLGDRLDARQKPGHATSPKRPRRKACTRSISHAQASRSRSPAVLSIAVRR